MKEIDNIQDDVDEALRELLPFEPDREARERGIDDPPEREEPDVEEIDALVFGDLDEYGFGIDDYELDLGDEL
jgi:hypothetical protein